MHADDGGDDAIVGAEGEQGRGEVRIGDVRLLIFFQIILITDLTYDEARQ